LNVKNKGEQFFCIRHLPNIVFFFRECYTTSHFTTNTTNNLGYNFPKGSETVPLYTTG